MTKKYVSVKFKETPFKSYHFATDIEDLEHGDMVVVDTKFGSSLAEVEHYVEFPKEEVVKILKWVIQKVDLTNHKLRLEKESRVKEIKLKMESRRKELEEVQLFALLAKEDDGMKALFEEFLLLSK